MSILVSGSLALDHIMVFPDRFKDHILPDKIHVLNVSFNIQSLETHFGGVAGNIAYLLRQLGEDPLILATVGSDFGPYAAWLDRHAIRRDGIRVLDDVRTAQQAPMTAERLFVELGPVLIEHAESWEWCRLRQSGCMLWYTMWPLERQGHEYDATGERCDHEADRKKFS